jgi:ribosome-binding protein aMBF1 (putative translation factor)
VIQIMKRKVEKYDFKALGQAIKEARNIKGLSRNQLADIMNIAPRMTATAKGILETKSGERMES